MAEIWTLKQRVPKKWIDNFMKFVHHNNWRIVNRLGILNFIMGVTKSSKQGKGFELYFQPKFSRKLMMGRAVHIVNGGLERLKEPDLKNVHTMANAIGFYHIFNKKKLEMSLTSVNLELFYALYNVISRHEFYSYTLETLLHEIGHIAYGGNEIAAGNWAYQNADLFPKYTDAIRKIVLRQAFKTDKGELGYNKIITKTHGIPFYRSRQIELNHRLQEQSAARKMILNG